MFRGFFPSTSIYSTKAGSNKKRFWRKCVTISNLHSVSYKHQLTVQLLRLIPCANVCFFCKYSTGNHVAYCWLVNLNKQRQNLFLKQNWFAYWVVILLDNASGCIKIYILFCFATWSLLRQMYFNSNAECLHSVYNVENNTNNNKIKSYFQE